jgi:predicted anti-sigma-YlaC factor YlaD
MKCGTVRGLLSSYIDGEAAAELRREMEEHLAGCEECRSDLDTLSETVRMIRALAPVCPELPTTRGKRKEEGEEK